MKPSLSNNFTISVRHQIWEESPEFAEFYQGIYSVTLNFLVNIMFVPGFEINVNNWPPRVPENIDNVSSKLEARLFTLFFCDYIVTPDQFRAGQQEVISLASAVEDFDNSNLASNVRVVFYVTPEEFTLFSKELHTLSEQTSGIHDYVRISEIDNLQFAKFILSSVINSQYLLAKDKEILASENERIEAVFQSEN
ncbi:hypothetical protein NIES4071_76260 [Calothrix sp. NIES-4071]|nr:hypothetical protein NIES4071_76260 [Calothrix sp. NIES-4071]BAZ61901.1 hypothetical protein NIES4105_76210 [Calothrix sp. NIES-4105]